MTEETSKTYVVAGQTGGKSFRCGYDAGYTKGHEDGYNAALREKAELRDPKPLTDAEKVRKGFFDLIDAERSAQNAKWGFPNYNTFCEWGSYLAEECGEAVTELNDLQMGCGSKERLVEELVDTAATCLSILQQFDVAQITTRARHDAVQRLIDFNAHEPKGAER